MEEKKYISNQISKYSTNKKLIEFVDKLNPTTYEHYAHIHSVSGDTKEGRKLYSIIGINMVDYSNGTGDKSIKAQFNISPTFAKYLFALASTFPKNVNEEEQKIMPDSDENGNNRVTKISFIRSDTDKSGNKRTYPWYIRIENGIGKVKKFATGAQCLESGTYKCEKGIFINLSDKDFFVQMSQVCDYIRIWEMNEGSRLLREKKNQK